MSRAKDNEIGDESHSQVLPILIHGDAAFAGQGIVAETLNMSHLEGYRTGGTIHIIVNNQIGFTTSSVDSRSSYYATDVSKMIQAPIIHVNGNDPEAVVFAASFAIQYRNKFNGDIIIDILSYRKYGHNEADEPTYTQPLLYKKIKALNPIREIYEQELIKEKVLSPEKANIYKEDTKKRLNNIFSVRKKKEVSKKGNGKYISGKIFEPVETKVSKNSLLKVTEAITKVPDSFQANPKVLSLLQKRKEMMHSEVPAIDWAMAEALALGSLLIEGKQIRFSGQDSRRGTFSQRHAVLTDIKTEVEYTPLNHIELGQSKLRIYDSPLSEMAVLGYEYGYSVISNNSLTLWEAQFGDFANGAQPIFDQFIAAAEAKWGQVSNLVVLLPHGYDGQGPEHSSARLERYLQLCAQENIIVGYFSTPAQYFHALRRQVLMPYKKPMILMTPKSMLRNTLAVSGVDELVNGQFMEIIPDKEVKANDKVEKLLLCSGKVYYDLLTHRSSNNLENFPIIRIEQLYPLNTNLLISILNGYPNLKEIRWVQEEPENMGAWRFVFSTLFNVLPNSLKFVFAGRGEAASTASGSYKIHNEEQASLVRDAFV
jgi:2-oxoglutarate dehydrogenase E1 component